MEGKTVKKIPAGFGGDKMSLNDNCQSEGGTLAVIFHILLHGKNFIKGFCIRIV